MLLSSHVAWDSFLLLRLSHVTWFSSAECRAPTVLGSGLHGPDELTPGCLCFLMSVDNRSPQITVRSKLDTISINCNALST